ncbi:MAG: hypothetical protein AVDCRST_MAG48-433, partial [uncultured Friedmanniella sp.]
GRGSSTSGRPRGDRPALAAHPHQDRRGRPAAGRHRPAPAGRHLRPGGAAAVRLPLLLLVPAALGLHRRRPLRAQLLAAAARAAGPRAPHRDGRAPV